MASFLLLWGRALREALREDEGGGAGRQERGGGGQARKLQNPPSSPLSCHCINTIIIIMWDLGLRGMWSRLLDESVGLTFHLVVLSHEISEIGRTPHALVIYSRESRENELKSTFISFSTRICVQDPAQSKSLISHPSKQPTKANGKSKTDYTVQCECLGRWFRETRSRTYLAAATS